MLKAKIKLPEKALRALPDRLGNLVAGSDGREQEIGGSDWALEFGEELETFQPNGLGLGGSGPEIDEYERDDGKCSENEFEQSKVRPRNERDVGVSVSVKEIIAADERRSDLDYEEINLEKLQRIASSGLLDGGGLRATAWKIFHLSSGWQRKEAHSLLHFGSKFWKYIGCVWIKDLMGEREKEKEVEKVENPMVPNLRILNLAKWWRISLRTANRRFFLGSSSETCPDLVGNSPRSRRKRAPNSQSPTGAMAVRDLLGNLPDEARFDTDEGRFDFERLPLCSVTRQQASPLLLGYLPASRDLWEKELAENRLKYAKLKEELLLSPSEFSRRNGEVSDTNKHCADSDVDGPLERHTISDEDHPLKIGKASVWHQFFQFKEIAEQIDRDLQRTHPDMKFFSGESSPSRKNREAMRNILLLFAKLNPEIRYVQGMNEVLAPIYYIFSTDTNEQNAANAEADSFSCFVRLLSDSVDHFCQQLDNSSVGIHSTLSRLSELLKANDEELWRHLEFTTKVNPQFYAFRWITLLLTQEFDFQPVLRIWDTLLSNPFGVQEMLLRVCCAMLLCVKSRLLSGDFIANLKLLQHYPEINIEHLLSVAKDIIPDTSSFHLPL
ncbi:Ypt/Rab-GAP domain of gyp1p superfamily protein [Actinidia rufa]|uniref:Ypt/Rab-GAP domain of gyp1p superfamily protein n=1 Tax=Actinidia rufa TaxID=165716 RepID=A0A7J0HCY9_9ERIC|nr:Ypt/Rab-GAP domain of gyp1p superfamily protein [Actinidia rufa]